MGRISANPALLNLLTDVGLEIGAGTLARWLADHTGQWHDEAEDVPLAGLASGPWQATDQTATRVDGQNEVGHVVGNDMFTSYHTRPGGTRQDVLAVRWGQEPVFRLHEDALAWLAETSCRPALVLRLREALPWDTELTGAEVRTRLLVAGVVLNTHQHQQAWDALAVAA